MKKKLLIASAVVVLAVVGLVVSVILGINPLIKTAVEQGGTFALKVPNELGQADLALMSGDMELTGYAIRNPEGFKTPSVFSVDRIALKTDPGSLRTDVARVELIAMNAPHMSLEATRDGTNVGVLIDNLGRLVPESSGGEPTAEPSPEPSPEEPASEGQAEAQRRFVIDRFEITGTQVTLAQSVIGDTTYELTLPDLILEQLGTEGAPVTLAELMDAALQGLVVSVLNHEDVPPQLRALLAGELDLARLAGDLKAQLLGQLDGAQQRLNESLARGREALNQGAAELQGQIDDAEAQAREQLDAAKADAEEAKAEAKEEADAAQEEAKAKAKEKLGGLFGGSSNDEDDGDDGDDEQ